MRTCDNCLKADHRRCRRGSCVCNVCAHKPVKRQHVKAGKIRTKRRKTPRDKPKETFREEHPLLDVGEDKFPELVLMLVNHIRDNLPVEDEMEFRRRMDEVNAYVDALG